MIMQEISEIQNFLQTEKSKNFNPKKKKHFLSNKTSLDGSRKIKKKIFLNSTQQLGVGIYSGVFNSLFLLPSVIILIY